MIELWASSVSICLADTFASGGRDSPGAYFIERNAAPAG